MRCSLGRGTSGVDLNPFVRQSRPGDVAAPLFQPPAVVCLDPDRSMQAEAVDVGALGLMRCGLARHHAPARQHLQQPRDHALHHLQHRRDKLRLRGQQHGMAGWVWKCADDDNISGGTTSRVPSRGHSG
jgi:hypothetical protein